MHRRRRTSSGQLLEMSAHDYDIGVLTTTHLCAHACPGIWVTNWSSHLKLWICDILFCFVILRNNGHRASTTNITTTASIFARHILRELFIRRMARLRLSCHTDLHRRGSSEKTLFGTISSANLWCPQSRRLLPRCREHRST